MQAYRVRHTFVLLLVLLICVVARAQDPLPSWNDGPAKKAVVEFVAKVTQQGGPDFVPAAERVAVLDNDGTLWCEQPMYPQLTFAFERGNALAPQHPEWKDMQPLQAVLQADIKALATSGGRGLLDLMIVTHAGMTTEEFRQIAKDWLATARHPRFNRPYTECVYLPMVDLLAWLRANGFKTFIVTGGGVEFVRVFSEEKYGIPPEQVVGSSVKMKYEVRDGKPVLVRLAELEFMNDREGKPLGIDRFIGRRPILAFGNSDGDFQMLEWTTAGPGARLGLLVHHDDAEREYACDRTSPIGKLVRGLDEAPQRGWVVVSMKKDWKRVFSFQP